MKEPLVSIIIPTYNRIDSLKIALDSALKQNYDNLEIVVSDDCSTDGTDVFISKYLDNPKIKYFRNEMNLQFAGNHRQAIMNYAKGEYGLILSDDDYLINSEFVSKAVIELERNQNLSFIGTSFQVLFKKTNKKKVYNTDFPKVMNGKEYLIQRLKPNGFIFFIGSVVFRMKNAISLNPFNVENPAADGEFIDKLSLLGDIGFLNIISVCYSIHENNWSKRIIDLDKRIKEFDCPLRVIAFANDIKVYDKRLEEYKIDFEKKSAIKIYKDIFYHFSLNFKLLKKARLKIKDKTGSSYFNPINILISIIKFKLLGF